MTLFVSQNKDFLFHQGKKSFLVKVKECSVMREGFGLMFRTKNTDNLLFEFSSDKNRTFTSLFVFFPYLSVWLDSDDKIIECRLIKPFTTAILASKKFRKVLELPLNRDNRALVRFLVGKGKV